MTRRMLINAQRPEELRVAVVNDSLLESFQVETAEAGLTRGNIYRGIIATIQPALNAAFIDYDAERNGFLSIQDVVEEARYKEPPKGKKARIEDILERGMPIVVQVTRDPEEQKGAVLSTNLSLAGRYLVLTPFDDMRGVSRKVEDEETRRQLKDLAARLEVPKGCGVIVRTNALDQNRTTLTRDLAALLRLWKRIQRDACSGWGRRLLYSDQDLILRALRDSLDSSVEEVLADADAAFAKAQEYMDAFMPRAKTRLVRYTERLPLFARFGIEEQLQEIFKRKVALRAGGSIVIDGTEALTAIDVNSGKSTGAATQEETALQTNLEAAAEVARQLRLRDLGGLVVVDFIDMRSSRHQKKIEKALREAMKPDRARFTVGRISPNGLLEINRQRLARALRLRTHRPCPTCDGTGRIASPEMVGLNLLRRIEARAVARRLERVRVRLHPELADAVQNTRRQEIEALEREFGMRIEFIAAAGLHRPDEQIEWIERPGLPLGTEIGEEEARAAGAALALPPEMAAGFDKAAEHREQRRRHRGRRGRRGKGVQGAQPVTAVRSSAPETARESVAAVADGSPLGDGSEKAAGNGAHKRKRRRGGRGRGRGKSGGAADPG